MVESLKKWRPFLWGRHFTLVTDHAALKWLHTMRETTEGGTASRLMRWIMRLQEYDFEVVHKPGALHADADAISRLAAALFPRCWARPGHSLESDWRLAARARVENDRGLTLDGITSIIASAKQAAFQTTGLGAAATVVAASVDAATHHLSSEVSSTDALKEALIEDELGSDLVTYMTARVLPVGSRQSERVRRLAPTMVLDNGLLYRWVAKGTNQEQRQLYVPEALRPSYLEAFHDRMGHPGRGKTYDLMKGRVFWPKLWEDVTDHVNACHECSFGKRLARTQGRGHTPCVGDSPFDTCVVDILSMGDKKTSKGNSKVLIFVDTLTRWVEAVALPGDPTSEEVLNHFISLIVTRYGLPRAVRSDCGSNLSSKLVAAFYKHFGIAMELSAAEHHQSLGVVERFNDTLVEMTKTTLVGKDTEWDDHLDFLLYTYRATPHRSTVQSPASLLFGYELRLPTMAALKQPADITNLTSEQRAVARRLLGGMRAAWESASAATRAAQLESRSRTDRRNDTSLTLVPNERVLLRKEGILPKLALAWEGPFRVLRALGDDNYELRDLHDRRKVPRVHVSRLRPYLTVTDEERLEPDEFIVDYLFGRRDVTLPDGRVQRQYKVKWRGYPKAEATWSPRELLIERPALAEAVDEFDATLGSDEPARPRRGPRAAAGSATAPAAAPAATPAVESEAAPAAEVPAAQAPAAAPGMPTEARLVRGVWHYLMLPPDDSSIRPRWYPSSTFSDEELARFAALHPVAFVNVGLPPRRLRRRDGHYPAARRRRLQPRRGGPTYNREPPPLGF